ncbi:hypothetical protein V2G26_000369 [Clonostachys chloroleuca]
MFTLHNIRDGEVVHQKSLLLIGRYNSPRDRDGHVQVQTANEAGRQTFPTHSWPVCDGWFKCLAILSPGKNIIHLRVAGGGDSVRVCVDYVPLLDIPPLHLVVMLAADSPGLMDCPPSKPSPAHSNLHAAVAKLRMAACMWQALTAEEMRAAGLGRRTFRLEEHWSADSLSRSFSPDPDSLTSCMRSTIKVHVVRSDKTAAQIRDRDIAQQYDGARDKNALHGIFLDAMKRYGPPFEDLTRPIVAGLIFDSHYDKASNLITGHAALGSHNPTGISLGMCGSHVAYAWPRFIEEVPDCLLDTTPPGDTVGNDCNACLTNWEACTVGLTAFIHEVGHAFSAPHTSGIMGGGCSRDFPKNFLSTVAYSRVLNRRDDVPITIDTDHMCRWALQDLLRFVGLPHFRHPSDPEKSSASAVVTVEGHGNSLRLVINCKAGIAEVNLNGTVLNKTSISNPAKQVLVRINELSRFSRNSPLQLQVLSMNGKHAEYPVWSMLSRMAQIQIPGTDIHLRRKSVGRPIGEDGDWPWAVLLNKRDQRGNLARAYKIDLRVGWRLDGAEVYFEDRTKIPCGRRGPGGNDPDMGGHMTRKLLISRKAEITKVLVSRVDQNDLCGLRVFLSNGKAMGALNKHYSHAVETLVPDEGQIIVGFYGTTGQHSRCNEFGIITAPRNIQLPDWLYDMPELQNNPKDGSGSRLRPNDGPRIYDMDIAEDQDGGYDCHLDVEESD